MPMKNNLPIHNSMDIIYRLDNIPIVKTVNPKKGEKIINHVIVTI